MSDNHMARLAHQAGIAKTGFSLGGESAICMLEEFVWTGPLLKCTSRVDVEAQLRVTTHTDALLILPDELSYSSGKLHHITVFV